MNPQPDIQSLIDDINSILPLAPGHRLPWSRSMPRDAAKQRRVLERVRDYLLHQQLVASPEIFSNTSDVSIDPRLQQLISQQVRQELQAQANAQNLDSQNLGMGLDALENWGQYSPEELIAGKSKSSFSDIQQQEIMSSFSALMHGLQESLHQQMQQAFTQINSQITEIRSSNPVFEFSQPLDSFPDMTPDPAQGDVPGVMSTQERWQKMQLLQQQSDQLLLAIDTNQRIIFETLQRHLQTYQQSLTNKLSGMYQLGMQTEVIFNTLVQQLVQQMETELAARQKLASELAPNLAIPELLPNQGSQAGVEVRRDGLALALQSNIPLTNIPLAPASPPALSFSLPLESMPNALQGANQDLTREGIELNLDILGTNSLETNSLETNEADIDALINLNLALDLENGSPTLPEDIDGILASLNTPIDPFAADKDTIPDGGEELYASLFSLELEENDLESALFGPVLSEAGVEEILDSTSTIISSPEDVTWEVALFATDTLEFLPLPTSGTIEEEPEIIQQLTDLIDPANLPELPTPPVSEIALLTDTAASFSADGIGDLFPDLGWNLDEDLGDDRYISAAPGESLLVPSSLNLETEIALDQDIWMQLDQDLADFEAGIPSVSEPVLSDAPILSDALLLSEVEAEVEVENSPENLPENLSPTSEIIPSEDLLEDFLEDFVDRPISDELLAEDWPEISLSQEDILGSPMSEIQEVADLEEFNEFTIEEFIIEEFTIEEPVVPETIIENIAESPSPTEERNIEEKNTEEENIEAGAVLEELPKEQPPEIFPREDSASAIVELPPLVDPDIDPNSENQSPLTEPLPSLIPSQPPSNFASLDLDADELASLEGISLGDAPQSESALIAQLLMDEALDQELAVVNSLEINSAAQLNPEDPDLLESLSVEFFDNNDLDQGGEGLSAEELGELLAPPLSLLSNRLIISEDDTLTEIPHDEDEPMKNDIPSQDWQDHYSLSEPASTSEIRFLDNGELLVETEANIETNYPLNLDESELMKMVWNQILDDRDRPGSTDDPNYPEGQDTPYDLEEQELGEYSSQDILDLEIQEDLQVGFPGWENSPIHVEDGLDNDNQAEILITATVAPAITATLAPRISNLGSNPPELVNPDHYQIPQGTPLPLTALNSATWYLGIDFGTTNLAAVLLNQTTGDLYPLYWQQGGVPPVALTTSSPDQSQSHCLPTGVYGNPQTSEAAIYPVGLGVPETVAPEQILCQNFKPYLDLGIPYWTESGWQPILRLAQNQPLVDLHWLEQATQALLTGLNSHTATTQKLRATGIAPETLGNILEAIAGVILNCPIKGSDAYRWNLREAVLGAGLVSQPEQVVFVEEAIAPFLASLQIRHTNESRPVPFPWRGYTLVINSGATATEFALVDSTQPQSFTHGDFGLWSFPYAGNAFDQDIICQLLLSPATKIMQNIYETDKLLLNNDLELPIAGELETTKRQRLHFWLQSSAWGQTLLIAAQNLKLHLQTKTEHRLVLGSDQWLVPQTQYESMVVIPFLQQLNQQLNNFLSITGVAEHTIFQVICAGGMVSGSLLDEWLKIKLPQAVVIQHLGLPAGTTVAAGLASLPLYPQICNQAQQYSDYFLLMELLRILPLEVAAGDMTAPTYHLEEITQLLERRGINTKACGDRLLDILRGELPIGLIPQLSENIWLTPASQQHPEYLALKSAQLFTQVEQNSYQPNLKQCQRLYKYMTAILDKTQQKLEEPLIFDLGNI